MIKDNTIIKKKNRRTRFKSKRADKGATVATRGYNDNSRSESEDNCQLLSYG